MKSHTFLRPLFIFVFAFHLFCLSSAHSATDIVSDNPHLKKYLHQEPDSQIRFGMGLSPIMIMKNKAGASLNIFQLHWRYQWLDWEVFSASFGTTMSGDPLSKINSFTFRSIPKFKFSETLSAGPLFGLEFVSFPDISARIKKNIGGNNYFTPIEPFSSQGFIYGAALSQTFPLSGKFTLRLNQIFYKQNYDVKGTSDGWSYFYSNAALNSDPTPIEPGIVIVLEISLLF